MVVNVAKHGWLMGEQSGADHHHEILERHGEGLRIALIGTRGVPANYGGFETCAEEVSVGLAARGHEVVVYCRRGNAAGDPTEYRGVKLRYVPHIEHKALGTMSHTVAATIDASRRHFDVLLYFNAANALPALLAKPFARQPIVINVDGLEWRRRKWGWVGRTYYQFAEWLSTKVADRIISDARAIQDYYEERWSTPSSFVAYGAHVEGPEHPEVLRQYGLEPDSYFFTASRLEPENNADITVRAFERVQTEKKLVIAGGANYKSDFVRRLQQTKDARIVFLGPVYEPGHIRELHCGAFAYVHGNEVGGTNPALLKALGYGNCVLTLNVPFNAEVVPDAALLYDKSAEDLAAKMTQVLQDPELVVKLRRRAQERIKEAYQWEYVVEGYERILRRGVAGEFRNAPPSDIAYPLPGAA
jgi:glycosyltransferase involved in cell wall biosynthesis